MRLTVVGSGTAAPEADRVCSAYFVEAAGTFTLLDCGPGAVHHLARFGLPWQRLDHLVVSHFHNDHIGDIPMLLFALKWGVDQGRTRPLHVWGPRGLADRFHRMAAAFGDHVTEPGFPVEIRELEPGAEAELGPGLRLGVESTPHTEESVAYRMEAPGGARLGYTGDTGPAPELGRFMAGVHVLVGECSVPDGADMDIHLTPSSLAEIARIARPGLLVVSHVYPVLAGQDLPALLRAAGWAGDTVRAVDGMTLDVPSRHSGDPS